MMKHTIIPHNVGTLLYATLFCLISASAAGIDWRDLDPAREDSAVKRQLESGKLLDAGEWGATVFPVLAKEIWQNNIHRKGRLPYPLSPYQIKWLEPWLTRWGVDPKKIQVVYEADLLNDYKILDLWPIPIMDELAGQTFGNVIYLRQPYREKDGNLLVLLSHEAFHVRQYQALGSIAEFGRKYVQGYIASFFSYENNPMEVDAYDAQDRFKAWLCKQEGWSCE